MSLRSMFMALQIPAPRIPIRYIYDWASGDSGGNSGGIWCEIQAIVNGVNIAQGKTATSSTGSFSGGTTGTGYSITDGSVDYATWEFINSAHVPAYVQIDLGAVYTNIESIKVWHYWGDPRTFYDTKTEVSANGVDRVTLRDSAISGTYAESPSGLILPIPYR